MDLSFRTLISTEQLAERIGGLVDDLQALEQEREVVYLAVEYGAIPFANDLLAGLGGRTLHTVLVSTYQGETSAQRDPVIQGRLPDGVAGSTVVVIEDILDTGRTLHAVREWLLAGGAEGVEVCVLLNKRKARDRVVDARYVGFEIEDEFVIGYGLDYREKYRDLPYVAVVESLG